MPIKPENRHRYPKDWPKIRARIDARAKDRCDECGVPNKSLRGATVIVCATAHLDHQPENCADENLRFWCQRCHLRYDAVHHAQVSYQTRRQGRAAGDLFSKVD